MTWLYHAMTGVQRHPKMAVCVLGSVLAILPAPVSACTVIGMYPGGPGVAPTPICGNYGGLPTTGSLGGPGPGYMSQPMPHFTYDVRAIYDTFRYEAQRTIDAIQRRRRLMAMPWYQDFVRGSWSYFDSGPVTDGKPRRCGASFMKEGRVVILTGEADPNSAAMLSFIDFDSERSQIPLQSEPRLVAMTLDQTGADRASVRAWNHTSEGAGVISFAVPSLRAGVDGLSDAAEMRVRIRNRDVFAIEYHSGLQAQARLRACLDAAPNAPSTVPRAPPRAGR